MMRNSRFAFLGTMMPDYTYYINGAFVPASEAAVPVNDLGFVRGYGVFDVLRTYGTAPFELRAHLERLQRSAAQIDLPLPWSLAELEQIVHDVLAHNDARDVTVRIVVTGGESANFMTPGGMPSLLVLLAPIRPYTEDDYRTGASLVTVDLARFMPTVKSLNYISAIMGQKQARAQGAVEALFRTPAGEVVECTTSNLFIFHGDQLVTPEADVLPGITRQVTLELAGDLFEVVKRPIRYGELAQADEVFITSTTKEIMPIVRIDDLTIAGGHPGPRTHRLHELFRAYVSSVAVPL
jgi:branched-chain amino acid aminotransferase